MFRKLLHSVSGWPFSGRQKRVMQTRKAISKDEFVVIFSARNICAEIAGDVWDHIRGWCIDGFTPYPDDDIGRIYGLAEEELEEDVLLAMLRKFDCHIPSYEEILAEGLITKSVEDVVIFVDRMQKRKRQRSSGTH